MRVHATLPEIDNQPPIDAPEPEAGFWETVGAGWTDDAIRTDVRNYSQQVRMDIMGDIVDRLPPESRNRVAEFTNANLRNEEAVWKFVFDEAAQVRDPGLDPGWANLPSTPEEREELVTARRRAELDEAQAVLANGSGVAAFLGSAASAVADPINVAMTPLGFGGSVARVALSEAVLGGIAGAAALPRETQVARELGIEPPNPVQRIALEAGVSGIFGGVVSGVARYVEYRSTRRGAEAPTRPANVNPLDHEARIAGARQELERPAPRTQDPADWERIKAGIFAGESRGDYDALFGFSNRPGGPWSHVKLTEMTVDEAIAFADPRGPYAQWVKRHNRGVTATPMGAFQIVGTTLRGAKHGLNLTGRELMTPELQDELGKYILRTQGTGAWVGYRGPRTPGTAPADFAPYRTLRGYTGTGQMMVGDETRIDVSYEVVDASLLRQASGDLQPRDRGRVASDAWVSDTAARLDPAQLMPSPTADRGAPLVGPDGMIESGNGRVRAIERAYAEHPDRAGAYRQQIEAAGYAIPEGVERPVLIARRTTDLDDAARRQLVVDAQDSGVARLTATERSQIGSRALDADLLARLRTDRKLSTAENRDFARRFAGAFPRSERNAFINEQGRISTDGIRQIQDALFARAWEAPDIVARAVEAEPGQLKSLIDALAEAAPEIARLRADIDAGLVRADMDITPWILDAARIIIAARDAAGQGRSVADILEELLAEVDLLEGPVAPLTRALVRAMMPSGRQAPARAIADFLSRYASEARKAGQVGDAVGGVNGPLDVLKRIDPETFGDLTETGAARIRAQEPAKIEDMPDAAFADGAASPEAELADQLAADELGTGTPERAGALPEGYDGTLESITDPAEIVMPIDRTLPKDQVRAQIRALTDENRPIIRELIDDIDRTFGTESGDSEKALAKVTQKAQRPSILKKKPWHTVAHIRDSYRFKTVVDDFRDIGEIFELVLARGIEIVKIDTGKLFAPQEWGWRIVAFDLRMPNGQLVEYYLPIRELEVQKKARGHLIFEEWRNKTEEELFAKSAEYRAAIRESFEGYDSAFRAALDRLSLTEEEAATSWSRIESSLREASRNSRRSSGVITSAGDVQSSAQAPSSNRTAETSPGRYSSTRGAPSSTRANGTFDGSDMVDTSTQDIAAARAAINDLAFEMPDGTTVSAREILDDLEADDELAAVIDLCATGGAA